MIATIKIPAVRFDRSFYRPGQAASVQVELESVVEAPVNVRLVAWVTHLAAPVLEVEEGLELTGGPQHLQLTIQPPGEAPRGYGLEVCLMAGEGQPLACHSSAFDVLNHWTEAPRYGFLSDFYPGRADLPGLMAALGTYHLNGLQFYDWMYRHEQLLTEEEPYRDPLGRELSRTTVEALIAAVHERNIAALPYTAVYATSIPFFEQHPDWALYTASGLPHYFGEDFLVYMDPRPGSPWTEHLLGQFAHVLEETRFDGIHLDQYGDPKEGFDAQGARFDLAGPLGELIDATKRVVEEHRPGGSVIFNAVTNWPIESVAPARQDLVYIEVWAPHIWFQDLHTLIVGAQELGDGKPVILAAYISPAHETNVRLIDAVIFASGGAHIELGELDGMLADAYFPNYERVPAGLGETLRRYYEFALRYQDVIGPRTGDATRAYHRRILLDGASTAPNQMRDKVWPIVRESAGYTAISLINLLGLESPEWRTPAERPPQVLEAVQVRVLEVSAPIGHIWFASPDEEDLSLHEIPFTRMGQELTFELPALRYWDLILLEKER